MGSRPTSRCTACCCKFTNFTLQVPVLLRKMMRNETCLCHLLHVDVEGPFADHVGSCNVWQGRVMLSNMPSRRGGTADIQIDTLKTAQCQAGKLYCPCRCAGSIKWIHGSVNPRNHAMWLFATRFITSSCI